MKPASRDAYRLLHQGTLALSRMERNGMPVCEATLSANREKIRDDIRRIQEELRSDDIYLTQRRMFGKETSLGSLDQLSRVLYDDMKIPGARRSANGKYVLDDETLEAIEREFDITYLSKLRYMRKMQKLEATYLNGLLAEVVDGRVHGVINLHLVKTYRGSADSPNLNNLPTRNKAVSQYVKGAIKPRKGWRIVEIDFSALEVRIAACYHRDPTMLDYLASGFDMHQDVSKQCYKYDVDWIKANKDKAKVLRTAAKSDAVFSWMYGNYYVDVCYRLWKTAKRQGMLEHLAANGIKRFGLEKDWANDKWIEVPGNDAFVTHIKEVENDFWNRRFKVYNQWRRDWFRQYQQTGFFETLTGFRWHGVEKRNFVINCPVQGSAFHCLLQSIIDIQSEIDRRGMQALLVMEIHDSLIAEVPENEVADYVALASKIMQTGLRARWPWIIMDLPVEVETSPVSWHDKTAYHL